MRPDDIGAPLYQRARIIMVRSPLEAQMVGCSLWTEAQPPALRVGTTFAKDGKRVVEDGVPRAEVVYSTPYFLTSKRDGHRGHVGITAKSVELLSGPEDFTRNPQVRVCTRCQNYTFDVQDLWCVACACFETDSSSSSPPGGLH